MIHSKGHGGYVVVRMLSIAAAMFGLSCAAMAQEGAGRQPDEIVRSRLLAEHNQLGLLEYCQSQGTIGADVVAMQRAAMDLLPQAGMAGLELDEAEAAGRRGIVAFGTSKIPVAQAAMGEGVTVASRCKQMALVVEARAGKKLTW